MSINISATTRRWEEPSPEMLARFARIDKPERPTFDVPNLRLVVENGHEKTAESAADAANYFPKSKAAPGRASGREFRVCPEEVVLYRRPLGEALARARVVLVQGETAPQAVNDNDDDAPHEIAEPQPPTTKRKRKRKPKDRRRRTTRLTLKPETRREMLQGWHHARRIGRPLNHLLTIRPAELDALELAERHEAWQRTYKKLEQYARTKGFEWTAAWARESDRDTGDGEHWHILCHLPDGLTDHFETTVRRWFAGPREVDLRLADQFVRRDRKRGKIASAATYITKAAHPHSIYGRPEIPYRPSGPVFGKRGGVTRNIGRKAGETWREPAEDRPALSLRMAA